ncbi:MAG: SAM-dependent methyltransferase [Sandaracinaceae bacterium]|jgi:hypothetical protein|nr:SAM-dependent methyltransferase [Sandaracinaceae bacterium]MBK8411690.1 SAM-dependent methyltransferase [Sandaracinaceae bacterium]
MDHSAAHPPQAVLLQMLMGPWVAQALGAVARLGVADHLTGGPKSSAELAELVGADADALGRTLRALSTVGVFSSVGADQWGLSPVASCLVTDAPGSMRFMAQAETDRAHWATWERFTDAVRTGKSQATQALGCTPWDYYAQHADDSAAFSRAMANISGMAIEPVLASYDFSQAKVIADIGGAYGALLAAILRANPSARGVLFDLPHVVEGAGPVLGDVAPRVERVSGSFLEDALPAADLYVLKHILHDWDDARSVRILEGVRAAMTPGARVLVVEMVVPEPVVPGPATWLDLNMLVMLDGRERTAAQYQSLLERAGLQLRRVIPTPSPFGIVEAEAR